MQCLLQWVCFFVICVRYLQSFLYIHSLIRSLFPFIWIQLNVYWLWWNWRQILLITFIYIGYNISILTAFLTSPFTSIWNFFRSLISIGNRIFVTHAFSQPINSVDSSTLWITTVRFLLTYCVCQPFKLSCINIDDFCLFNWKFRWCIRAQHESMSATVDNDYVFDRRNYYVPCWYYLL